MRLRPHGRLGLYELESVIAEGGLGEVWRARHTTSGRLVALRILPSPPPADPFRFARFEQDVSKLISLRHVNIAKVYELLDVDSVRALVFEWVSGESLATYLAGGPIPIDEAVPVIAQIGKGLAAAHARDLVHGDVKPSNIVRCPNGTVKVLDLGLIEIYEPGAAAQSGAPANSARLLGAITGTAAYFSPEQIVGKVPDSRSDVWAFGCVLYEILTGRPAFAADDLTETMALVSSAEPEWTLVPPSTPPELVDVLRRCLKKDAAERVQRMADVLAAIRVTTGEEEEDGASELQKQHGPALKRWLRGRLPPRLDLDANSLVDETLEQFERRFETFTPRHRGAISAYLRRIVLNRIRDEMRRHARRSGEEPAENEEFEVFGAQDADVARYREALERLSERDRALIVSRLEDGDTYDHIAGRFSFPSVAAARVAVMRALRRLAELLTGKKKDN